MILHLFSESFDYQNTKYKVKLDFEIIWTISPSLGKKGYPIGQQVYEDLMDMKTYQTLVKIGFYLRVCIIQTKTWELRQHNDTEREGFGSMTTKLMITKYYTKL